MSNHTFICDKVTFNLSNIPSMVIINSATITRKTFGKVTSFFIMVTFSYKVTLPLFNVLIDIVNVQIINGNT